MKLKSFCTTKEMVTKLKRQPIEWENIFASYISDVVLITRAQRTKLPKNQRANEEMANESNRAFSKEEVQMAKKHLQKC
jgi:hypothetical protein